MSGLGREKYCPSQVLCVGKKTILGKQGGCVRRKDVRQFHAHVVILAISSVVLLVSSEGVLFCCMV